MLGPEPDRTVALTGIAGHLKRFWDPRMRRSLLDFVAQNPSGKSKDGELLPIVLQAVVTHKQQLEPRSQ